MPGSEQIQFNCRFGTNPAGVSQTVFGINLYGNLAVKDNRDSLSKQRGSVPSQITISETETEMQQS